MSDDVVIKLELTSNEFYMLRSALYYTHGEWECISEDQNQYTASELEIMQQLINKLEKRRVRDEQNTVTTD